MPATNTRLPQMTADNMVGIVWVLTRSAEPGTLQLFQVICDLQREPVNNPDRLYHVGNFRPADLLNWAYENHLAQSMHFEAPDLWRYLGEQTALNPFEMVTLRPIITDSLAAEEALANADPDELLRSLPTIPRAA